jgi:hypothetical protein
MENRDLFDNNNEFFFLFEITIFVKVRDIRQSFKDFFDISTN